MVRSPGRVRGVITSSTNTKFRADLSRSKQERCAADPHLCEWVKLPQTRLPTTRLFVTAEEP
jgi:hypothetical protein